MLHIGNFATTDLASRFGTPLYVYDAAVIRRQMANVKRAFSELPLRPFYAMKANANLSILRLIREQGFGCDAVSPGEIFLAKRAGFESKDIWFTCSNVSDDDLQSLYDAEIVINVNSMSEIDRLIALDLPNRVALRVNPDVGAGHHADVVTAGGGVKFGIDLAEVAAARMVIEDSGRRVVGLHAHIGSGIDRIEPLIQSARRLLEAAAEFQHLKWINFGGGHHITRPDYDVERLLRVVIAFRNKWGKRVYLEPGEAIVTLSANQRMLERPSKYGAYHHITNCTPHGDMFDDVVVAGNLCESGDVFTRDPEGHVLTRSIERTQVGDLFAFHDAGAYGFSMASHYNARLLPEEVLVDGDEVQVIRERQAVEDLARGME